jgi:hypothetical protein
MVNWWALANIVIILHVPHNAGYFLISQATAGCSRTQLHEVTSLISYLLRNSLITTHVKQRGTGLSASKHYA